MGVMRPSLSSTSAAALALLVVAHGLAATALGAWAVALGRRVARRVRGVGTLTATLGRPVGIRVPLRDVLAPAPPIVHPLPPDTPMSPAPAPAPNATRAYLLTTCAVFALLVVAHVVRVFTESRALATDPWFVLLTVAAAALSAWAWVVARRTRRNPPGGARPNDA